MGKKKRKDNEEEILRQTDYYKLKTKAVDDLVTADESNSPEVSEAELRKYRSGLKINVASWIKMLLVKFWFTASTCYFFFWGLSGYMADMLDLLFVTGIAMGIVTDLLTNNALRFFAKTKGGNDKYMMFPKKGYASFPLNIVYAFVLLYFVFLAYTGLNRAIIAITNAPADSVPLGVEPILFGLIYLAFDLLLIKMKHLAQSIYRDARKPSR